MGSEVHDVDMKKTPSPGLKSAYERAMERFGTDDVPVALTDGQKATLADLTRRTEAKLAEIEILYQDRLDRARVLGNREELDAVREAKAAEITRAHSDAENERAAIRSGS